MGCGASSIPVSNSRDGVSNENYDLIINGKCPHVRLDHGNEMKVLPIVGDIFSYTASYCYVSQRGYYPNALGKANQDSYVIAENVLKDKSCHLFGVFDGHGEFGDYCSHYAADTVSNI